MADQLLDQVRDAVEGQIIFAFFIGFMAQDIKLTLYIGLAGTALTFLAVVPPWPFFNKNPEPWLSPHIATSGLSIDVDGQKVG
ncbi:hypothetical protein N0V90_001820 [Kalmusia sp. IMI 367209]|nr:hypothetical protein N0V90_001820 [Kalmusia sp. IMI 367209]